MRDNNMRANLLASQIYPLAETHVSGEFNIPTKRLRNGSRRNYIAVTRHIILWITNKIAPTTWNHLSELAGYTDHTSSRAAVRRVRDLRDVDTVFRKMTDKLLSEVKEQYQQRQ